MAVTTNFKISGLEEARAILKRLPDRVQKRVLAGSVRAGGTVVRRAVRNAAPVGAEPSPISKKYGPLKKNIRLIRLRKGPKTWAGYRVDTGNAPQGFWYEFGTVRQPPRPWFRPAADTAAQAALGRMREQMAVALEREALKLAGEYPTKAKK